MRLRFCALLLCFGASSAALSAVNGDVPRELLYNGKPIDSLCFSDVPQSNQIDLRNCGAAKSNFIVKEGYAKLLSEGFIGYSWQDREMPSSPQGSTYYRFYPAGNSAFWIYSINNGGGSGDFTNIYLVKRQDENTLTIKSVDGGDRCNGGVENVTVNNNVLSYSVNLTAFDVIALANPNTTLKAYDDLASCAVCCTANANYTIKADDNPVLANIKLEKFSSATEMPDQGKLQSCFNKLSYEYISKNELTFTQVQLQKFAERFSMACTQS